MSEISEPRKPENWPDEIRQVAEELTSIVAGTDRGTYDGGGDPEKSKELLEISVDQWSDKDFVEYFVDECHDQGVPYIKNYARDTHQIKQIKKALKDAGHGDRLTLKRFLDWSFAHKQEIIETQRHFTLVTLPHMLNEFLQNMEFKPEETEKELSEQEGPPRWGGNLAEMMVETYHQDKTTGLLIRYGVPLTAAFLKRGQFSEKRITKGISDRLTKLVVANRQDDCRMIAKQSIANSPYPGGFPLKNWRDEFSEVWKSCDCASEAWWREQDNWGEPYADYQLFLEL